MIDTDKYKKHKITLTSDNHDTEYTMSVYELSRWCTLIQAVEVVDKKLKQLGVRDKGTNWVKPIALQKYVDEKYEEILFDITTEPENVKIINECTV